MIDDEHRVRDADQQVRRPPGRFEVFDRCTGAVMATEMRRSEAERDALFFEVAGSHHGILEDLYALFRSWQQGDTG